MDVSQMHVQVHQHCGGRNVTLSKLARFPSEVLACVESEPCQRADRQCHHLKALSEVLQKTSASAFNCVTHLE